MKKNKKQFAFKSKHLKIYDNNMRNLIFSSLSSLFICIICFAASTWAWFSDSAQSNIDKIETGNFNANISVINTADSMPILPDGGVYMLDAAAEYKVIISAPDESMQTSGYCTVKIGGNDYCTKTLSAGSSLEFTIKNLPSENSLSFMSSWGTLNLTANIENGTVIDFKGTNKQMESDSSGQDDSSASDTSSRQSDFSASDTSSGQDDSSASDTSSGQDDSSASENSSDTA